MLAITFVITDKQDHWIKYAHNIVYDRNGAMCQLSSSDLYEQTASR